ncbi:MAG: sterol desaturase family protein [Chitinophagaceae bacterium]|nr:sterol desaturase family protein [Chitinophagaceae bacterium]
MNKLPDFSSPVPFLVLNIFLFLVIITRYFVVAGLFQLFFYNWFKANWAEKKLSSATVSKKQFYGELKWSLSSSLIFSIVSTITIIFWQQGYTKVYTNALDYGVVYLPVSLLVSMLIHETYYYFLHRWMHQPNVFKLVHKAHHASKTTSAWTAFSFHPIEGFLQAIVLPVTILVLPMHIYVLLVQLTIMTVSSVINHLEIEVYPTWFQNTFLGKWIIGASHHSLHHKQVKYNFGLYFTFWDKWIKTESPTFTAVSNKQKP